MALRITPSIRQEEIASRIERAYLRRRPEWRGVGVPAQVWTIAATTLSELNRVDPTLPVDPELYVASQPAIEPGSGPWEELIGEAAERRYRRQIRRIVRNLRRELGAEVRRAEGRIDRGEPIEDVLARPSLSDLGRYIVARRAGRPNLAETFLAAAQEQHRSCPLYRVAARPFLSRATYPVLDLLPGFEARRRAENTAPMFSVN
jgi:hypothetical protein